MFKARVSSFEPTRDMTKFDLNPEPSRSPIGAVWPPRDGLWARSFCAVTEHVMHVKLTKRSVDFATVEPGKRASSIRSYGPSRYCNHFHYLPAMTDSSKPAP